jgi:hypothetical protein
LVVAAVPRVVPVGEVLLGAPVTVGLGAGAHRQCWGGDRDDTRDQRSGQ